MRNILSVLSKYGLHPVGGVCTCFSNPHSKCNTCEAVAAAETRWKTFIETATPEEKQAAKEECDRLYPKCYDNVNGGR